VTEHLSQQPIQTVPPQAPSMRRGSRTPWIISGVSVAVAIVAVLYGLGVVHWPTSTAHPFNISGSITIQGSALTDYVDDDQGGCQGTGGYSDMTPGTAVTVADSSGRVVATGSLGEGTDQGGACELSIGVPGVPAGLSEYVVTVSHRGSQVIPGDQVGQPLVLTLGG
jgi:hypothetical protein